MLTQVVYSPPGIRISYSDKHINTHIIMFTHLTNTETLPRLGRAAALLKFYKYRYNIVIFALSGAFYKRTVMRMRK